MSRLTTRQKVIAGAAVAAAVAAFLPWWSIAGFDVDGWSTGTAATGGTTLLFVAAAYLVARRLDYKIWAPKFGDSVLVAVVAAAGLALVLIRWATLPTFQGVHAGARYGIWLALAAGAVETAAAIDEARNAAR